MRLDRLDLTRYGKFTDARLDFGAPPVDGPDLHIVYGPNEAGKSTALSAFLDLLFGIEGQSRYDFLHAYPSMQIGARLTLGGHAHELVRTKKLQDSLRDAAGRPVGQHLLSGAVAGIERGAYRAMFSLDDDTLEAGGDNILAAKGDLGELLFSGSTGLASLSDTLERLKGVADDFFRKNAHKGELNGLKKQFVELGERRKEIDMRGDEYAALVSARDRAATAYAGRMAARARAEQRRDRVKALLAALPWLGGWRALQAELTPLRDLPEAPAEWIAEVETLSQQEIALGVQRQGAAETISRLEADRDAIILDTAMLAAASRLDELAGLHGRYGPVSVDLPKNQLRLAAEKRLVADFLRRLEQPEETDPKSLMLPARLVAALRQAMVSQSGIAAELQSARQEMARAERKLAERQSLLPEGGQPDGMASGGGEIAALSALIDQQRGLDHAARRRVATADIDRHAVVLARQIALLHPWTGDADALARMAVPTAADIQAWQAAQARSAAEIGRHADDLASRTDGQAQLRTSLDAMRKTAGIVDDAAAADVRGARDTAWVVHRAALDAATADDFASEMRRHDRLADARFAHAGKLATLHQLEHDIAVGAVAAHQVAGRLAAAREEDAARQAEIAAAIGRISPVLPSDMPLPQLGAWLQHRADALATADLHAMALQSRRAAEVDAGEARDRLVRALSAVGVPHDPAASDDALRAEGLAVVARAHLQDSLRHEIEELQRDVAGRRDEFDAATRAMADWDAGWAETCGRCWFGAGGAVPDTATVGEILAVLGNLTGPAQECASLAHRIAMMEAEARDFAEPIGSLAADLAVDPSIQRPIERWNALRTRLAKARDDQRKRADKEDARTVRVAELRELDSQAAILERRVAEMAALFGVTTLADVRRALQQVARRHDLRRQAEDRARDICATLQTAGMAEAVDLLDAVDRDMLTAELAEVEAQFTAADEEAHAAFAAKDAAQKKLDAIGGDNEVALLEERRRTLLVEIEDKAMRYLRLRAGILAANQALQLYRDRHRSSMMQRAADAFVKVSRGAYRGLATQPEKGKEVLIGIAADGSSKLADGMSKGTRFQLYLALRVAGYYEFAGTRDAVPFVADDIMETFDDFRAEETFDLLAGMARVGQVIYLTHHRHLCDIARTVCPGVRIHELPGPLTAA